MTFGDLCVPTNLVPQHALQPVLSGCTHIDGEFGFAVDRRQRSSGQQVVSQPHLDLNTETPSSPASVVLQWNHLARNRQDTLCVLGAVCSANVINYTTPRWTGGTGRSPVAALSRGRASVPPLHQQWQ